MKRILVCGDRKWDDYQIIYKALAAQPQDTVVIEGEQTGADLMAKKAALALGLEVAMFPAQWDAFKNPDGTVKRRGNPAGPVRNLKMLQEGKPTVVVGFHDNLAASRGTKHMLKIALEAGVQTFLYANHQFVELSKEKLQELVASVMIG